jgi:hypothetical protein
VLLAKSFAIYLIYVCRDVSVVVVMNAGKGRHQFVKRFARCYESSCTFMRSWGGGGRFSGGAAENSEAHVLLVPVPPVVAGASRDWDNVR